MPVYLVHGFRWPRDGFTGIRVHAIVHNLEDCSVEYIQNENSRAEILSSFRKTFPDIMKELEGTGRRIDFLEQYDPEDESSQHVVSQPYAFVGDRVFMIAGGANAPTKQPHMLQDSIGTAMITSPKTRLPTPAMSKALPFNTPASPRDLSINVGEVIADGPGLTTQAWEALADLRDKIAENEQIGWWVVYNGDPERLYEGSDEDEDDEEMELQDVDTIQEKGQSPIHQQTQNRSTSPNMTTKQQTSKVTGLNKVDLPTREKVKAGSDSTIDSGLEKSKDKPASQDLANTKSPGLRKKLFGKRVG